MSASTNPWTPEALATLAALYPNMRTRDLAVQMGRKEQGVAWKAWALGIRKSPEYVNSLMSGRIQAGKPLEGSASTQFAPGQVPWNAGLKGWQSGGNSASTQFKAGQKPHTTMPIGSYRLCFHKCTGVARLEQKTSEAQGPNNKRWTPVSRLVWEAAHGPVPKGCIVVFKPGMGTNVLEQITLDRLDCLTRGEHANRNHPRNQSIEIARLVQLKGAIARQVNRITRAHEAQQQTQGHPA